MMRKKTFLPLLFSILLLFSCKEEKQSPIQQVYVNTSVFLNTFETQPLRNPGGYVLVNGGVEGIILVHTVDGRYRAFDRVCSYDPNGPCKKVSPEIGGLRLIDSCCGSAFSINYGTPTGGPASAPLLEYVVKQVGNRLDITNQ